MSFYVIEFHAFSDGFQLASEKSFKTRSAAEKFCAKCYKAHPNGRFRVVADDEEI